MRSGAIPVSRCDNAGCLHFAPLENLHEYVIDHLSTISANLLTIQPRFLKIGLGALQRLNSAYANMIPNTCGAK